MDALFYLVAGGDANEKMLEAAGKNIAELPRKIDSHIGDFQDSQFDDAGEKGNEGAQMIRRDMLDDYDGQIGIRGESAE